MGRFEKGHPKYDGQGKRGPSKFTTLKKAFLEAFNSEKLGGVDGLIDWAVLSNKNKSQFYQMIAKLLPKEIVADIDVKATKGIKFKIEDADGNDNTDK